MTTHQIKRYLSAIPDSVPHRVAGMDWIKWPVCIGLGGRIDWITQLTSGHLNELIGCDQKVAVG
ncbi:MAG: hypothetical protein HOL70_14175 [Candidatus Marinimicrobia bacterium]|nr:hypothetical protein [Candidatus Neomarinimicrobiota bacterium]